MNEWQYYAGEYPNFISYVILYVVLVGIYFIFYLLCKIVSFIKIWCGICPTCGLKHGTLKYRYSEKKK